MENWRKLFLTTFLTTEILEPLPCKANTECNCVVSSETPLTIIQVQDLLNNNGYSKFLKPKTFQSGTADGICGQETRNAIMAFQKDNKIQCDGCVGDETHGKMAELGLVKPINSPGAAPANTPKQKSRNVKLKISTNTKSTVALDPLRGKGRWTSRFNDTHQRGGFSHHGLDISAAIGTPIYPIAKGVVIDLKPFELFDRLSRKVYQNSKNKGHPGFLENDTRKINYKHPRIQPNWSPKNRYCPWNRNRKTKSGKIERTGFRWVQELYNNNGFGRKEGKGYWHHGGIWVMIKHKIITDSGKVEEVTAQYAHLHDLNVKIGDKVDLNTIIGTVGRSGIVCNQPHLHLEIFTGQNKTGLTGRTNGRLIDPASVLKRKFK